MAFASVDYGFVEIICLTLSISPLSIFCGIKFHDIEKYQWHVLTIIILVLFWVISATDDFYWYEEFHLKELLLVD